jgi:hypothetical protein
MFSTNLSYCESLEGFVGLCPWLEVEGISSSQLGGEKLWLDRVGLFCRRSLEGVVTSCSLGH